MSLALMNNASWPPRTPSAATSGSSATAWARSGRASTSASWSARPSRSISRQPESAARSTPLMFGGLALVEALALFGFALAFVVTWGGAHASRLSPGPGGGGGPRAEPDLPGDQRADLGHGRLPDPAVPDVPDGLPLHQPGLQGPPGQHRGRNRSRPKGPRRGRGAAGGVPPAAGRREDETQRILEEAEGQRRAGSAAVAGRPRPRPSRPRAERIRRAIEAEAATRPSASSATRSAPWPSSWPPRWSATRWTRGASSGWSTSTSTSSATRPRPAP